MKSSLNNKKRGIVIDLTILIPTKDRPELILKLLSFYEYFNFKGNIFIIDSSNAHNHNQIKKIIKNFNLNVFLFHESGYPWQVIKKISKKINTNYFIYTGDDDYLIIDSLKKIIITLEKNSNFVGYCGKSLIYSTRKNKFIFKNLSEYKQKKFDHDDLILRLKELLTNYTVPHFTVYRLSEFILWIDYIPTNNKLCPLRSFSDEYLISLFFVASGKIGMINDLLMVRVGHDYAWHHNIKNTNSLDLKISIDYTISKLFHYIKSRNIKIDFEIINKKLHSFFKNRILIPKQNKNQIFLNVLKDYILTNFIFYYSLKINYLIKSYNQKFDSDVTIYLKKIKQIFERKIN